MNFVMVTWAAIVFALLTCIATAFQIALLFGVSMDWLFGNTDNQSGTPMIDISSLNNPQINIVRELVSEFKRMNKIANIL